MLYFTLQLHHFSEGNILFYFIAFIPQLPFSVTFNESVQYSE